jgi:hypothetical protein
MKLNPDIIKMHIDNLTLYNRTDTSASLKPGLKITIKIISVNALIKQYKYIVIENVMEEKVDRVNHKINIKST